MPDLSHQFGFDLSVGPTGDLALSTDTVLGQQRVLRRLLTNAGDYIWQLTYGAGLPGFVGQTVSAASIRGVIRTQLATEAMVAKSPAPVIDVEPDGLGSVYVTVRYADAADGTTQVLGFRLGEMS